MVPWKINVSEFSVKIKGTSPAMLHSAGWPQKTVYTGPFSSFASVRELFHQSTNSQCQEGKGEGIEAAATADIQLI